MGEWSEYFEDFPEENPGNYVGGRFDPDGAKRVRELEKQQIEANSEITSMLADAWKLEKEKWKAEKERSLLKVGECPQCGLEELNIYHIKETYYLCECQECGIYGKGCGESEALRATESALGEGLDWKDGSPPPWAR